jgi:osmotically-inducible protein OsmY
MSWLGREAHSMKSDLPPTAADMGRCIEEALAREAVREAPQLGIHINDGVVTLRGCVHSWHERDAIQDAAAAMPGGRQ